MFLVSKIVSTKVDNKILSIKNCILKDLSKIEFMVGLNHIGSMQKIIGQMSYGNFSKARKS